MNITIYNGNNTQNLVIEGVTDETGSAITGATITGQITRPNGVVLTSEDITFTDVTSQSGNYEGQLIGFDAPVGPGMLVLTGSTDDGKAFGLSVFCTITQRSL